MAQQHPLIVASHALLVGSMVLTFTGCAVVVGGGSLTVTMLSLVAYVLAIVLGAVGIHRRDRARERERRIARRLKDAEGA